MKKNDHYSRMKQFVAISLLIAFLYGVTPTISKYVLKDINIVSFILCESVGVFFFTILFCFYHYDEFIKDIHLITYKSLYSIGLVSFLLCVANVLFYFVLEGHESFIVSAIVACSPVVALLISWVLLEENVSLPHILGVIFITAGIICISV